MDAELPQLTSFSMSVSADDPVVVLQGYVPTMEAGVGVVQPSSETLAELPFETIAPAKFGVVVSGGESALTVQESFRKSAKSLSGTSAENSELSSSRDGLSSVVKGSKFEGEP